MSDKSDEHAPNWGGARKGAGRPSMGDKPSVRIQYTLAGELAEKLEALANENESLNKAARRLLKERLEQFSEE